MIKQITKTTSKGEPIVLAILHARAAQRGVPLAGTFELTARCNFNCKMCYIHQNCSKEKELSTQQWLEIAQNCKERGMLFLLLTGGEPLLRDDFYELYLKLNKMGFMISINTNGSLITDEIMKLFDEYPPLRVNISLYGGSDKTYERLCGNQSFETVRNNILKLKKMGINVKINCSMTPYNSCDLIKIHDFAKETGVPIAATSYMYPPTRINGKKYGDAPNRFEAAEAAEVMLQSREQLYTPEQLAARLYQTSEDTDCGGEVGLPMSCRAGKTAFWITWDGRMLPCGMFPTEGYKLSELGFAQAWEEVRKEVSKIIMPKECTNCSKKEYCNVCAAACLAETGDTRIKPEYICQFTYTLHEITQQKYGKGEIHENK